MDVALDWGCGHIPAEVTGPKASPELVAGSSCFLFLVLHFLAMLPAPATAPCSAPRPPRASGSDQGLQLLL